MATTIYCIRHPESAMNQRADLVGGRSNEAAVTPRGEEQLRRLSAVFLEHYQKPVAIFSSPAVRTMALATHLAEQFHITKPITVRDGLQEMSQGAAEGQPRSLVYTPTVLARIALEQKDFSLPESETVNEVTERMLDELFAIHTAYPNQSVAVAGHGQAIRCVLGEVLDWSHSQITQPSDPRYNTENVSVTELHIEGSTITAKLPRSIINPVPRGWRS